MKKLLIFGILALALLGGLTAVFASTGGGGNMGALGMCGTYCDGQYDHDSAEWRSCLGDCYESILNPLNPNP